MWSIMISRVSKRNVLLASILLFTVLNLLWQEKLTVQTIVTIKGLIYPPTQINKYRDEKNLIESHFFKNEQLVKYICCKTVFEGNDSEIERAVNISKEFVKKETTPAEYTLMTKNCSDFIHQRGYITYYLTEVEKDFPIAYSILMYTDVEQSERLLRTIYRPQNVYCIHVDAKSRGDIYTAMVSIAICFDNVFMAKVRHKVKWGTSSVLQPEIDCMELLWNMSATWKYFINLTGQEFPLKTNYELVLTLQAYNGSNDIMNEPIRKTRWRAAGSPPHGIVAKKGPVHIVASRGYVDFAIHDRRARDLLNWTRQTYIPDETFFVTLNFNPALQVPGSYRGDPKTISQQSYVARYKNWFGSPCRGKFVRNVCIIGVGDLPVLAKTNQLFVNKIHLNFHPPVLDCLEELLRNRTRDAYLGKYSFDPQWYSTLERVKFKFK